MTSVMQQAAPQQLAAFARVMAVQAAPTLTDNQALTMPDLFPTWEQVLEEAQPLKKDSIINDGGTLYRVVQDNTIPQAHQPPHGEGMLAVYRPIDKSHEGTADDPIPWIYGMDCHEGTYYSYNGKTYLCKSDRCRALGTGYAGPVAVGGADVTTDVILAAMSLLGTLAGTFGGILVSQRLTTYRLELLDAKCASTTTLPGVCRS